LFIKIFSGSFFDLFFVLFDLLDGEQLLLQLPGVGGRSTVALESSFSHGPVFPPPALLVFSFFFDRVSQVMVEPNHPGLLTPTTSDFAPALFLGPARHSSLSCCVLLPFFKSFFGCRRLTYPSECFSCPLWLLLVFIEPSALFRWGRQFFFFQRLSLLYPVPPW